MQYLHTMPHPVSRLDEAELPDRYAFTDEVGVLELSILANKIDPPMYPDAIRMDRYHLSDRQLCNAEFGVVFDDRQLVGFGRLAFRGAQGELGWLMVDPGHRHQGIGRAIIDARLRLAAEQGVDSLFISRIEDTNTLRTYYQEQGFRTNEYGALLRGPRPLAIASIPEDEL